MTIAAKEIIQQSIVIDNAFGFEPEIEVPYKWDVLDRFAASGFSYMSLSIATDMTSLSNTMHYLSEVVAHIKNNPTKYRLVKSYEDIILAKRENRLALSFMFQGTNAIEKNLHLLETFYQLGVRSMIISYNTRNAMGDGCAENSDAGLSRLGKQLIAEMNNVGMIIDCSHTGYKTSMEAMELSSKPVIFSHSNVYNINSHARNLKDDQIIACANTGGFIGINGNGPLLGDNQASIKKYVDHLEYIIQLVGDDHVGFGTDLVYFPEIFDQFMKKNAAVYPATYGVAAISDWKSIQPEQLTEIISELVARGYQEQTLRKIMGENYLRVMQAV